MDPRHRTRLGAWLLRLAEAAWSPNPTLSELRNRARRGEKAPLEGIAMTTISGRASAGSPSDHDLLIRALGQLDELKDDVAALRGWNENHLNTHLLADNAFQTHLREATRREVHDEDYDKMQLELTSLHDFKTQVVTLGKLTQFIFGASMVGAMAAIASLMLTISHLIHGGG